MTTSLATLRLGRTQMSHRPAASLTEMETRYDEVLTRLKDLEERIEAVLRAEREPNPAHE